MEVSSTSTSPSFLRSEFTINSTLASFYNRVLRRAEFLKSLAIVVNIIRKHYENLDISRECSEELIFKYFEEILRYLNAYEHLKWLNSIYPVFVNRQELDRNIRRVADIVDNNEENSNDLKSQSATKYDNVLIKSFIQSFRNKKSFEVSNIAVTRSLVRFSEVSDYLMSSVFRALWPLNTDESLELIKYLFVNGQYVHLNNYCLTTKWLQKGKSLRFFLLANCCLFFNNVDQSIDLFIKASHFLSNDQMLKKLMKLVNSSLEAGNGSVQKASVNFQSRRRTINIARSSHYQAQMDNSIFNNTANIEIFDKLMMSSGGDLDESVENNDKILLDYYIKVIHYYDLNGNIEAVIELVQNALIMFQFDIKSKVNFQIVLNLIGFNRRIKLCLLILQ